MTPEELTRSIEARLRRPRPPIGVAERTIAAATGVDRIIVHDRVPVGTAYLVGPPTASGRPAQVVKIAGYAPAPVAAAVNAWQLDQPRPDVSAITDAITDDVYRQHRARLVAEGSALVASATPADIIRAVNRYLHPEAAP